MSVGDKTIGIRHGPIGLACLSAIFHDGRLGSQLLTMTVIYYVNVSHQRESWRDTDSDCGPRHILRTFPIAAALVVGSAWDAVRCDDVVVNPKWGSKLQPNEKEFESIILTTCLSMRVESVIQTHNFIDSDGLTATPAMSTTMMTMMMMMIRLYWFCQLSKLCCRPIAAHHWMRTMPTP